MKERLNRLLESRFRISTQLQMAIWGAVALTVAASLIGWFSFNRVGSVQNRVNEHSIPEMAASFGVAQYSGTLVAAAPRLTTSATIEEFQEVSLSIDEADTAFEEQLALLEESSSGEAGFTQIRTLADGLIANIDALKVEKTQAFALAERTEELGRELAELRGRLDAIIIPAIDDQLFYTITGYRTLGQSAVPSSEHFSKEELSRYRHLSQLQADSTVATELLANAFTLSDPSLIEPLRERFEAAVSRIDRSLTALDESPLAAEVAPIFDRLFELGVGEENGFDLLVQRLLLVLRQQSLVEHNQDIALELVEQVDGLVSVSQASAQASAEASNQAIFTGSVLLLTISGISIAGALAIAWLFVGRMLIRRLKMISDWMRRMAGGDLEAQVEVGGRDEVADMAAALEIFRRHALEVQRLNLVEKLAEELRGKNDQLESVLEDLRRAQDQIVMREKLAALGELTAGVAHEIRNPLNFVKNFSEASEELVTELKEVLEEGDGQLNDEQRGLIEDICGDLNDNLGRIQSHGQRADRIVHDMLRMGRDSGEPQSTNINNLLDEHARLAYHSTRATDLDFQLDLRQDLDPDMGEIVAIPQELGRVFLNMVSNSCYATDEKRRGGAAAGDDGAPYMPTLWLTTRRRENHVEVTIRDNGSGMPPEVAEKIFNPFFTTKPTDQGTGLGLSMCNDIVRRHGGTISVKSEPGEFTEMTIQLPLELPSADEKKQEEQGAQGALDTLEPSSA